MTSEEPLFDFSIRLPLDRFELDIEYKGSERVLGIFGVSGSGKTTILECLAGLRKDCIGRLDFSGETWMNSKERKFISVEKRRIGYVPQDHLLFPHCDARGNLEMGKRRALACGIDFRRIFESVVEVLELESLLDRRVDRLSGGERQRVSLGRALCSGPQLLLLDEPLSSLDAALRRRILPFLIRVRDTFELPMVVVSHNPMDLQALCGEVLVLQDGRILAKGSPEEVFARSEVFDTAKEQGFENVFSGILVEKRERTSEIELRGVERSARIRIPTANGELGETVVASLASDDLLIATERPKGLSARNCIEARIERIEQAGLRRLAIVRIDKGIPSFVVEITQDAIEDLALQPQLEVYLIFKTSAVRV